MPRVVIVGAGITGLATAYYLRRTRPDIELVLLEKTSRIGGNVITEKRDGFLLDGGPDSFLKTKPNALALAIELGLSSELIAPSAHVAYVARRGRLHPMPAGMVLSIPTRLLPFARTPLLSFGGKLRALGDLFVKPSGPQGNPPDRDESIDSFMVRHFGSEVARLLASPLLAGIYAGDASKLSMSAAFPELTRIEAEHGSLIRGFLRTRGARRRANTSEPVGSHAESERGKAQGAVNEGPVSPFVSLRGGMGRLLEALEANIGRSNMYFGVTVTELRPNAAQGFTIKVSDGTTLTASAVVLALPAHAAARIAPDPELASELASIPYHSTATVFLALKRAGVAYPFEGLGFIAPRGEAELLAGTWVSKKWAARAPDDCLLLRGFVGGAARPTRVAESSDEELAQLVQSEFERLTGPLGTPLFTRVFRYPDANPQPVLGHRARLARIEARLREFPGLYVAGAAYDGVGIPDCVRQGESVALRIVRERAAADAG